MKIKKIIKCFICIAFCAFTIIMSINFFVVFSQNKKIVPESTAAHLKNVDYAIVLGCGIRGTEPSDMLYDRLIRAVELMQANEHLTLILSGDNSGPQYNEVGVMHNFMVEHGISEERLIDDNYGFSTGESIENYQKMFNNERVIIITQSFHLYRALFIAERLDIEAYGLEAMKNRYVHEYFYSIREIAARNKDFIKYLIR